MTKPKLTRLEFEVTYWNENDTVKEVVKIRPPNLDKWNEAITLLEDLIKIFLQNDGSLGKTLGDQKAISLMRSLSGLMKVVGGSGGIDIDNLFEAGDILQLGQIFFSRSIKSDMKSESNALDPAGNPILDKEGKAIYDMPRHRILPDASEIARVLDIPFLGTINKIAEELKRQKEEEAQSLETNGKRESDTPVPSLQETGKSI